jgi:hypothetical protein
LFMKVRTSGVVDGVTGSMVQGYCEDMIWCWWL